MTYQVPVTIAEQPEPPTPPAGYLAIYVGTDGRLYYKNDSGAVVALT